MFLNFLKILNYLKKNYLKYILLLAYVTVTGCGDLVVESETGACDNAIDDRNYDEAIISCSSREDKASAYMGKAGYDIVNLLKSSSTTTSSSAITMRARPASRRASRPSSSGGTEPPSTTNAWREPGTRPSPSSTHCGS